MPDLGPPQTRIDTENYTSVYFSDSGIDSNGKYDVSDNSITGSTAVPAKVGTYVAAFDGTKIISLKDLVTRAGSDQWPLQGDPVTIDTWVQVKSLGDQVSEHQCIVASGNNNVGSYERLLILDDGSIYWDRGAFLGSNLIINSGPGFVVPGVWHHVAWVFDQAEVRLYFDGTLVGSVADTYGWANLTKYIGSVDILDTESQLNGYLDEFAIYHYARYTEDFNPDNPFPVDPPVVGDVRNIFAGDNVSPNQGQFISMGVNGQTITG